MPSAQFINSHNDIFICYCLCTYIILTYDFYVELQVTPKSYKNKMEQLFSSFALVDHPANKFPKDSFMTLYHSICDNILFEEIVKFRARHYSAHRITFVVQVISFKL